MSERNSMLCPNCRKLISLDEAECPYCGLKKPGSRWNLSSLNWLAGGNIDAVKIIIAVTVAYYITSLIISPLSPGGAGSIFTILSPGDNSLFFLGASGTLPIDYYGRWWTLISASFLHAGIIHLLFNMLALWQMGYFVLREYGVSRFFTLYLLTGAGGFFVSYLAGIPFTLGASASICGFIGAIIYYGKSRGGFYGEMIYRQAMGWVVGLAVFGFIIPGINNWAHAGGLLSGILFSRLLGYRERKSETILHRMLALTAILATISTLAWALTQTLLAISS